MFFFVPFGILTRLPHLNHLNFERQKENKYHENYRPGPKERMNMIASEYFEMLSASEWQVANHSNGQSSIQPASQLIIQMVNISQPVNYSNGEHHSNGEYYSNGQSCQLVGEHQPASQSFSQPASKSIIQMINISQPFNQLASQSII